MRAAQASAGISRMNIKLWNQGKLRLTPECVPGRAGICIHLSTIACIYFNPHLHLSFYLFSIFSKLLFFL